MSNVVRRATFVLDFTTGKSDVKAPDLSSVTTAQKAILEQQTKMKEAVDKEIESRLVLKRVQEEGVVAAQASFRGLAEGAQNAAEGVLLLARSMVLFGATEDDISKVLVQLAKIQGVIDLMRGLRQVATGVRIAFIALTTVMNPMSAVLLLVAGAIGGGVLAYKALTGSVETATEALRRHRDELAKGDEAESFAESAIGLTPTQKRKEKDFRNRLAISRPDASPDEVDAIIAANRIGIAADAMINIAQVPGLTEQQYSAAHGTLRGVIADAVTARHRVFGRLRRGVESASGQLDAAREADSDDPHNWSTSPREAKAEAALQKAQDSVQRAMDFFDLNAVRLGDAMKYLADKAEAAENGAISSP